MKQNICKIILFCIITIGCIRTIVVFELNDWPVGSSLGGLFAGLAIPIMISSFGELTDNENWKSSQRKLERVNLLKKTDKVRISFSYLFRIKVDGKYFLVKNNRGTGKYQPVGGVYKFNQEEAQYLRTKYYVEDDNLIPIDESSKNDYRLNLQDKYLRAFVRRFNKTKARECISDLHREFKEELFDTGILDIGEFGSLKYTYCGRHITELKYSEHFQCYELLLADIANVELTHNQEQQFRELIAKSSDKYYFATDNEIKSLGVKTGSSNLQEIIADHTTKILQENAQYLTKNWSDKNNNEFEISL